MGPQFPNIAQIKIWNVSLALQAWIPTAWDSSRLQYNIQGLYKNLTSQRGNTNVCQSDYSILVGLNVSGTHCFGHNLLQGYQL